MVVYFMNLISYYIIGQAILQLKFGPLQHCVSWINPHDVGILCVHACNQYMFVCSYMHVESLR